MVKYFVVHYTSHIDRPAFWNGPLMIRLAHVNIRTADLDGSVAFYRDTLGLTPGPAATRPDSRDHRWMNDDQGYPCIHLQRATSGAHDGRDQTGVHHVALACSDLEGWRNRLASAGVAYKETTFPAARIVQLNLLDPDGVRLELLFETA